MSGTIRWIPSYPIIGLTVCILKRVDSPRKDIWVWRVHGGWVCVCENEKSSLLQQTLHTGNVKGKSYKHVYYEMGLV